MAIEQNRTEFYSNCGRLYCSRRYNLHLLGNMSCTVPESFFRGVKLILLLVNQTNKITYLKSNAETNTTKIGSSSARKRNAMLMAFRWHGPRKFFQMGSTFFYCYCKGTLKQIPLKSGLRRPASETPS